MPAVSVIIPTFNHAEFVLATLESVFAQTFSDYEVIVVNDGSPDDTAEVLAPLASSKRIIYIEQPNAGQAAARNSGLARAAGEYIAFLDDDDLWPADKLAWQIGVLQRSPDVSAVGGRAIKIDAMGNELGVEPQQTLGDVSFEGLFDCCPFLSPGQVLIRGSVLRRAGGLNPRLWGADDYDLWFRVASHGRIIGLTSIALHYRVHPRNASKDVIKMLDNGHMVVLDQLRRLPSDARYRCARSAYRYLYQWLGRRVLSRSLRNVINCEFSDGLRSLRSILFFAEPALADRELFRYICGDLFRPWLWSANS